MQWQLDINRDQKYPPCLLTLPICKTCLWDSIWSTGYVCAIYCSNTEQKCHLETQGNKSSMSCIQYSSCSRNMWSVYPYQYFQCWYLLPLPLLSPIHRKILNWIKFEKKSCEVRSTCITWAAHYTISYPLCMLTVPVLVRLSREK